MKSRSALLAIPILLVLILPAVFLFRGSRSPANPPVDPVETAKRELPFESRHAPSIETDGDGRPDWEKDVVILRSKHRIKSRTSRTPDDPESLPVPVEPGTAEDPPSPETIVPETHDDALVTGGGLPPYAILKGHRGRVSTIAFSADGTLLATGTFNSRTVFPDLNGRENYFWSGGEITIWDVRTGNPLVTIKESLRDIYDLAFHPDGKLLASSSKDRSQALSLWDLATGKRDKNFRLYSADFLSLAYSPVGNLLAGGKSDGRGKRGEIWLWRPPNRSTVNLPRSHDRFSGEAVVEVAFNENGKILAAAGSRGSVKMFDLQDGVTKSIGKLIVNHPPLPGFPGAPAFSSDLSLFAWCRSSISIRDNDGQTWHQKIPGGGVILSAAFAPDGQWLALGVERAGYNLLLWNFVDEKIIRKFVGHAHGTTILAVSPDGTVVASSGLDSGPLIHLWKVAD